jgi:hypothetical protein
MNELTIHFKPTEKFRRAQMLGHFMPGVLLVLSGLEYLLSDESGHVWSPWLNIIAGSLVITTIIYEFRFAKKDSHVLINWVDIFAGIVLGVEGINHLHPGKWFQPGTLYIMLGCFTLGKGILHAKIPQIRKITFSDMGFSAKTTPLTKFSIEWNALSDVHYENPKIFLTTKTGKTHIINLRRVENQEEVVIALKRYVALKGI